MKKLVVMIFFIGCLIAVAQPMAVFAVSYFQEGAADDYKIDEGLQAAGKDVFGATEENSLQIRIGQIIQALVALVGVIFLAMIIIAGITWMTAGGGPNTQKARARIVNATIGLIITVVAYAVVSFVMTNVLKLTQPEVAGPQSGAPATPPAKEAGPQQ